MWYIAEQQSCPALLIETAVEEWREEMRPVDPY
jgi:hypothetical protein